ncbi:hypothetical protein RB195_000116 [Necator americanus]|uniref:Fungal lipase-type domain-containing protein n=1 Tax=Necator americanus TaxID=51031 RepID=A0ABR1D9H7_NECAM
MKFTGLAVVMRLNLGDATRMNPGLSWICSKERAVLQCAVLILLAKNCSAGTDSGEYTDDIGRGKFFPLAAAAYSATPQDCISNKFRNASLVDRFVGICDPDPYDSCAGFIALLHDDNAIVISFRGTNRFVQLLEETRLSAFHRKMSWVAGGYVSAYFHEAFLAVWNGGIGESLAKLQQIYPTYQIWVTGHSLGASMASLAASYIVTSGSINGDRVRLITYGQPRTGDFTFATVHNNQIPYSFRVVHWRDIVPHILMKDFEGYWHHKSEVFYQYGMGKGSNFTVCDADESSECSDRFYLALSIYDHLHYFDVDVSQYGSNGCIEAEITLTLSTSGTTIHP